MFPDVVVLIKISDIFKFGETGAINVVINTNIERVHFYIFPFTLLCTFKISVYNEINIS